MPGAKLAVLTVFPTGAAAWPEVGYSPNPFVDPAVYTKELDIAEGVCRSVGRSVLTQQTAAAK